jgi:hypothetical protein
MKEHFYGEWVRYDNEEEKIEAEQYLKLWKKFFLKKLPEEMEFVEDHLIDRPIGTLMMKSLTHDEPSKFGTLGVKICVKREENIADEKGRFDWRL